MGRSKKNDEMIIKINQVKEYLRKFDKQASSEFLEDFNTLVREILVVLILRSRKDRKRLNAKDVMMFKRLLDKCLKDEQNNDKNKKH